ncbi:VWA domain-containing protein [Planctomycetales bacterium 10988]|nr:VWA domain-containing protein [Planctomycetales bacterium 10988]
MPEILLRPVGHPYLVMALILLLAAMLYFGPSRQKTNKLQRMVLFALRAGAIALLFFVLIRPGLIYTDVQKHSATIVFLLDQSRSMQVTDGVGGTSRYEELQNQLNASLPQLETMTEDLEVKFYTFGQETEEVAWSPEGVQLPELAEAPESSYGTALRTALQRGGNKRLAAIFLLGDGANRALGDRDIPPGEPARILQKLGTRIYTFGLGQPGGMGDTRDVSLKNLRVNETVFVKNILTVAADLRVTGYSNKPIRVELLFENPSGEEEVVASQTVEVSQTGESVPIELETSPQTPGEYRVTLRAIPQSGELLQTNNQLSTFVIVLRGGINILYLEGVARAEQKYLRWSLGGWQNINLDYFEINARSSEPFPPEAESWFEPDAYDIYIIGDLDTQAYPAPIAEAFAEQVKNGKGLLFLGGFHAYGAGGYQQEPFADLMPIEMDRLERQRFGEPIREDLHLLGPQRMIPTPTGERHFVMLLGSPAENLSRWNELPPLEGANRFLGVKRLSQVLAQNEKDQPLLVAHDIGGRVLAFAGDSTWRWWMRGFQEQHRRFWRQAILWLARKEDQRDEGVWIKLEKRQYAPGDRVVIRAGAQNSQGEMLEDAQLSAEIELPDGQRQPLTLQKEGLDWTATFFATEQPGDYRVIAAGEHPEVELGQATARFLIQERDLELDNPAADLSLLNELALLTEGEALAPEQLPSLLKKLQQEGLHSEVETQTQIDLYDNWYVLLLFVGFLATEWFLRKRWSLV